MRNLYRLALMLTLFLLGFASAVAWMTLPQIKFSPRGMEWGWHWAHFEPFSNGIQKARTHDTKQFLLRRVYLGDAIVVFVSTTLDNKFEIDVVQEKTCKPNATTWASVSVNRQRMAHVPMVCDSVGQSYFYRYIGKHLDSLEFGVDESFITEDFAHWPIADIKVDQFKQQNAKFFEQRGEKVEHQWLRD
ncbi:threonine transporter RhtB [Vibrio parahaemolyticus]|uniref:threonine transporter RhtB n=1 Tax=Vibrio parahaemolyticus TaxID=670 RepID=UPI000C869E23|nr:threonine transporter RhtB [Vibrio parahaemolyticus]PMS98797.1 threonine transporter RhtB [Vibrio parahaemolyticus]